MIGISQINRQSTSDFCCAFPLPSTGSGIKGEGWVREKTSNIEHSTSNLESVIRLTPAKVKKILGEDGMFEWKRNGLRHSFISYRVAETQNVAQVALEAGNSPQMIFKHYRELVTPKAAAGWFGIRPSAG